MPQFKGADLANMKRITASNPELSTGDANETSDADWEIWDPRDLLTQKMDKLPILIGLRINPVIGGAVAVSMEAAGIAQFVSLLSVYNGEVEAENLIASSMCAVSQVSAKITAIDIEPFVDNYNQPILLNEKIEVRNNVSSNTAAVGADFTAGAKFELLLEYDFMRVSEKELNQYLTEKLLVASD